MHIGSICVPEIQRDRKTQEQEQVRRISLSQGRTGLDRTRQSSEVCVEKECNGLELKLCYSGG